MSSIPSLPVMSLPPRFSPNRFVLFGLFVVLIACAPAIGIGQDVSPTAGIQFDMRALSRVPEFSPAEDHAAKDPTYADAAAQGVKSMFYEGVPYQGKPTRVFAYYGLPKPEQSGGAGTEQRLGKVPGVVLIHGGGGTAFANWVKLWNSRGYAAIAMDLCGCVPVGTYGNWQRHPDGGPPGWDASFQQIDGPVTDQWQFHAVSAVALANSLLRSFPEVDADRIGVTGISWGGYMTCLVAGVDTRFKCSVPVYGCGYLGDNSVWLPSFANLGSEKSAKWLSAWDPSVYLPKVNAPMLWVNGTNDFAYPMDSWQRSTRLAKSPRALCLRINMPHGHGAAGENPEEIHVFMNSILKDGKPLPEVLEVTGEGPHKSLRFKSSVAIKKAELCYTTDLGPWQKRQWTAIPAMVGPMSIAADLPADATVWYFNLFDDRDCAVSSEHFTVSSSK